MQKITNMFEDLIADIVPPKAPWGAILLIINILWPGLGTIINSLMGENLHGTTLIVGLI